MKNYNVVLISLISLEAVMTVVKKTFYITTEKHQNVCLNQTVTTI